MTKSLVYLILSFFIFSVVVARANFNVTYLNTTVVLGTNTSARVVETLSIFVSNSSISTYQGDRGAINLSLTQWQQALGTSLLVQHILNPKTSVYGFTFLPGPLTLVGSRGGTAQLTMSYYVSNITSVQEISPRKFQYTFNNSVFNFVHSASGQQLPPIAVLNIVVPQGAQIVKIYPVPDAPSVSVAKNYSGATAFSWYSGEPLSSFTLTYIVTQSLGQEVISYFTYLEANYGYIIDAGIVLVILIVAYLYVRASSAKE